jgi:hypothetical protein
MSQAKIDREHLIRVLNEARCLSRRVIGNAELADRILQVAPEVADAPPVALGPFAIIDTDNLGGDYPDEKIVADGFANEHVASVACTELNRAFNSGPNNRRWFKVRPGGYRCAPGFEP